MSFNNLNSVNELGKNVAKNNKKKKKPLFNLTASAHMRMKAALRYTPN